VCPANHKSKGVAKECSDHGIEDQCRITKVEAVARPSSGRPATLLSESVVAASRTKLYKAAFLPESGGMRHLLCVYTNFAAPRSPKILSASKGYLSGTAVFHSAVREKTAARIPSFFNIIDAALDIDAETEGGARGHERERERGIPYDTTLFCQGINVFLVGGDLSCGVGMERNQSGRSERLIQPTVGTPFAPGTRTRAHSTNG
jgi:hypothetical protein